MQVFRDYRLIECETTMSRLTPVTLREVAVFNTEDVAPVVHAHWEYVKSTDHEWDYPWMCSECGSCSQWETEYCKDCGAKMDEVTDEDC